MYKYLILVITILFTDCCSLTNFSDIESVLEEDYLLPISIKPLKYKITILPNVSQSKFHGSVEITGTASIETNIITLHCDGLTVTKSFLVALSQNNKHNDGEKTEITIKEVQYNKHLQRCKFDLDDYLSVDSTYVLSLNFSGKYNEKSGIYKSFYYTQDGCKKWVTQTHFEPTHARRAFPCFDEPALKSKFTLSVARPQNLSTISNMPLKSTTQSNPDEDGIVWDKFEETPPMSTYLLAFAVGDYERVTSPNVKTSIWLPKEWIQFADYMLYIASKSFTVFQNYTGVQYALPKLDHVMLPFLVFEGMENWGMITYNNKFCEEGICTSAERKDLATIIAHEVAHQWFGNLVTLEWWSYTWLNEGLATFFQYYIMALVEPSWRSMESLCVIGIQEALRLDTTNDTFPLTDNSVKTRAQCHSVFSEISYFKGAAIVYMIQNILSEEGFRNGISVYLRNNAYGNVKEEDLWASLTTMADGGFSFEEVMHMWTHTTGYPLITVRRENSSITLTQEKYMGDASRKDIRWWIPLTYTTSSELNFNSTKTKEWFHPNATTYMLETPVDNNEWIVLNVRLTGYYRVNYDKLTWKLLAAHLNQCNGTDIPPVNRAQLLDDAFSLALTGHIDYKNAFQLANFLKCEIDYITWYSALMKFVSLVEKLYFTEAYGLFKSYMLELVSVAYDKYSFEKEEETMDEKINRFQIIDWACLMGHDHCQTKSVELMYLMMSGVNISVSADIKDTIMCTAVRNGHEEVWNYLRKVYIETHSTVYRHRIISVLACTLHRGTIIRFLTDVFDKAPYIREEDMFEIVSYIASREHNIPVVIDFILDNFKKVFKRLAENINVVLTIISSIHMKEEDAEKLKKIVYLLSNAMSEANTEIIGKMKENEDWMARHYDAVFGWLKDHQFYTEGRRVPEESTDRRIEYDYSSEVTTGNRSGIWQHVGTTFKPVTTHKSYTQKIVVSLNLLIISQFIVNL